MLKNLAYKLLSFSAMYYASVSNALNPLSHTVRVDFPANVSEGDCFISGDCVFDSHCEIDSNLTLNANFTLDGNCFAEDDVAYLGLDSDGGELDWFGNNTLVREFLFDPGSAVLCVAASDDLMFTGELVNDTDNRFRAYNVSDLSNIVRIADEPLLGRAMNVIVNGDNVVFHISNARPSPGRIDGIEVHSMQNFSYLGHFNHSLYYPQDEFVNIASINRTHIVAIEEFATLYTLNIDNATDIQITNAFVVEANGALTFLSKHFVNEQFAFMNTFDGIVVYDLASSQQLDNFFNYTYLDFIADFAVTDDGNTIFAISFDDIFTIDATNKSNLVLINQETRPGYVLRVCINGDYLLLTDEEIGANLYDISNRTQWMLLENFPTILLALPGCFKFDNKFVVDLGNEVAIINPSQRDFSLRNVNPLTERGNRYDFSAPVYYQDTTRQEGRLTLSMAANETTLASESALQTKATTFEEVSVQNSQPTWVLNHSAVSFSTPALSLPSSGELITQSELQTSIDNGVTVNNPVGTIVPNIAVQITVTVINIPSVNPANLYFSVPENLQGWYFMDSNGIEIVEFTQADINNGDVYIVAEGEDGECLENPQDEIILDVEDRDTGETSEVSLNTQSDYVDCDELHASANKISTSALLKLGLFALNAFPGGNPGSVISQSRNKMGMS